MAFCFKTIWSRVCTAIFPNVSSRRAVAVSSRSSPPAIRIERLSPRDGVPEVPERTWRGYQLVAPDVSGQKNKVENAVFVRSIGEAAALVEKGYALRMIGPGKRASLISASSLRVVRDG